MGGDLFAAGRRRCAARPRRTPWFRPERSGSAGSFSCPCSWGCSSCVPPSGCRTACARWCRCPGLPPSAARGPLPRRAPASAGAPGATALPPPSAWRPGSARRWIAAASAAPARCPSASARVPESADGTGAKNPRSRPAPWRARTGTPAWPGSSASPRVSLPRVAGSPVSPAWWPRVRALRRRLNSWPRNHRVWKPRFHWAPERSREPLDWRPSCGYPVSVHSPFGWLLRIGSRSCELRGPTVLPQDSQGSQMVSRLSRTARRLATCIVQVSPNTPAPR